MKKELVLAGLLVIPLAACAPYSTSGQKYERYETKTAYTVEYGEVVSTRDQQAYVRGTLADGALIVAEGDSILPEHLPLSGARGATQEGGAQTLADLERKAILETLEKNSGDRKRTAEELGISVRKLQYRIKEYGLLDNPEES